MGVVNHNRFQARQMVSDIVREDYRTADVFGKYEINYCCGGRLPLEEVCRQRNLDLEEICKELRDATPGSTVSRAIDYAGWPLDFMIDYILQIHHQYLHKAMDQGQHYLNVFALGHQKQFPYLGSLESDFNELKEVVNSHMHQNDSLYFPYIRQLFHAYTHQASYAGLLVKTLRKPIETVLSGEHSQIDQLLKQIREMTDQYQLPQKYCVSHGVMLSKLNEIDHELEQLLMIERKYLFPRAINLESQLRAQGLSR
jgi:regulator of cell morphogenesis and NO signaling